MSDKIDCQKPKTKFGIGKLRSPVLTNLHKIDVARFIECVRFPSATGTFVFLVLAWIMKSKVFHGKTAHIEEAGLAG